MLAEDEKPDHHENAFDMTYSWELHHYFNQVAKGEKKASIIRDYFDSEKIIYPENAFRMRFTSNHDENSWNGTEYERMGEAAETFAALTFVIPGEPLIYSGQEVALNKRLNFFEKDPINWTENKISKLYSKLTKLKKDNPALFNGEMGGQLVDLMNSNPDDVFSFARVKGDNKIISVFNLSPSKKEIKFSGEGFEGEYISFDNSVSQSITKENSLSLLPWQYKIFIKK
jgi:glycosidase